MVKVLKAIENFKLVNDKFIFESAKDFVDFKKNSTLNLEVLFEGLNMLSEQMLESIKGTRTPKPQKNLFLFIFFGRHYIVLSIIFSSSCSVLDCKLLCVFVFVLLGYSFVIPCDLSTKLLCKWTMVLPS